MTKISVDFDGTLVRRSGVPTRGEAWDCEPTKDAVETINLFHKEGHDLYILTARDKSDFDSVKKWLKKHGFPPLRVTNKKEKETSIYLDDRAIRFINWNDFRKLFF